MGNKWVGYSFKVFAKSLIGMPKRWIEILINDVKLISEILSMMGESPSSIREQREQGEILAK